MIRILFFLLDVVAVAVVWALARPHGFWWAMFSVVCVGCYAIANYSQGLCARFRQ